MRLEVEFTEQACSHLASSDALWGQEEASNPPAVPTPGISPVTCCSLPGKQCLLSFGSVHHAFTQLWEGYLINDCLLCYLCLFDLPVTFFPVKNFVYAGKFP